MKDILRRITSILLGLTGLATLGYYQYIGVGIVKDYVTEYNYYILGVIAVLFLAFLVYFGILSIPVKWLKVRAVAVGIVIILLAYYFITNDANNSIFAGDILMVLGVLIVYISLAGGIVTNRAQKLTEIGKQVIIEV